MTETWHYVTDTSTLTPTPRPPIENPGRIYELETDARRAATRAESDQPGRKFTSGTCAQVPPWATEVHTRAGKTTSPDAVKDGEIYATRARPATQFGNLPPGVDMKKWARVPMDLAHVFPDMPVSTRLYGEFYATRPFTEHELDHFQIEVVR